MNSVEDNFATLRNMEAALVRLETVCSKRSGLYAVLLDEAHNVMKSNFENDRKKYETIMDHVKIDGFGEDIYKMPNVLSIAALGFK